jgi:chromosome segregation ATPase
VIMVASPPTRPAGGERHLPLPRYPFAITAPPTRRRDAAPTNERQALERERAELPDQIIAHQAELAVTPAVNRERRERLELQIRNLRKRLVQVEARLAAIRAEQ